MPPKLKFADGKFVRIKEKDDTLSIWSLEVKKKPAVWDLSGATVVVVGVLFLTILESQHVYLDKGTTIISEN